MTTVLPELRYLPSGLVDGELVAWRGASLLPARRTAGVEPG
jgi:hypothetical protein